MEAGLATRTGALVLLMTSGIPFLRSQAVHSDTNSTSTISFQRLLNTFSWDGLIRYGVSVSQVELSTTHNIRSRLIRSGTASTQDDYVGQTTVKAPLASQWNAYGVVNSSIRRDNRAQELGRLTDHRAMLGAEFVPTQGVSLFGLGGYGIGSQLGREDEGYAYLVGAQGAGVPLEAFRAHFRTQSSRTSLGERAPAADSLMISVDRDFGFGSRNVIAVGYTRQKRQFYTVAGPAIRQEYGTPHNVLERNARELSVTDTLQYTVNPDVQLRFTAAMESRTIERGFRYKSFRTPNELLFDTRIDELNLAGEVHLINRFTEWLNTMIAVRYQEREERHGISVLPNVPQTIIDAQERSAKRLANIARRTSIAGRLSFDGTADHRAAFVGSATILRYDTPDTTNTDDRDELLIAAGIETEHVVDRYCTLSIVLDAALNHLVYLHRFQSANNNWHRVLRFSPKVSYQPAESFRTTNAAEVLAQYTVYDFEDRSAQIRSFSFRQASWVDSTFIRLSQRLSLEISGSLRLYERGILRWHEFKERPQHAFVESSVWPKLFFRMQSHVSFSVGFRYFSLERYRYDGRAKVFEQRQGSSGPTTEVLWSVPEFGHISIIGWRETQRGSVGDRSFSNVSFSANIRM